MLDPIDRPTPQTVIEAIMYRVRESGLDALKEPATRERIDRCDEAARSQINTRITRMVAAGKIAEVATNA